MSWRTRSLEFLVWGFLLAVILVISGIFIFTKLQPKPLPVYGAVGDFSLTNQHHEIISAESLRGHIWLADVIFTRCPTQCIRMTKRLRQLQEALPADEKIKFISITADPQFDMPEVLQQYAQAYGANQDRWWFLTGPKSEINHLAVTGLKLVVYEKQPEEREIPNDLFLHSTKFVLVDGQGNIRGWFDGEKDETKGEILRACKTLRRESNR